MRLDPRRRFRDRLLIAMVAVALLPLAAFAVLAAFELDGVSRGTAVAAQGAIFQEDQARQQTAVAGASGLIDERIGQIDTDLGQLEAQVRNALGTAPAAPLTGLVAHGAVDYSGGSGDSSSFEVPRPAAPDDVRLLASTGGLVSAMEALRHDFPEIVSVWVGDTRDSTLRMVPGADLEPVPVTGHLASETATNDRATLLTAARTAFLTHTSSWTDDGVSRAGGPYWTDPYPLLGNGQLGVSAWIPVAGTQDSVGVDVSIHGLVGSAFSTAGSVSAPAGAYSMLLSSSGTVVWASPGLGLDFNVPADPTGTPLTPPTDSSFRQSLARLEAYGQPGMVTATLGGIAKDVFAAPVYSGRWVLLRPVPVSALEPDLTGLTHGITAGVHQLFPLMVLPALVLLLGLAFVAATLLSRRLVGPVRRLTVAAAALASGRTGDPVPQQGSDEVGVLATTLERMRVETNSQREQILAGAAELEVRVAQRTDELRARNDELVALNALAASLTRSLDPQLILEDALDAVRAIHPLKAGRGYTFDGEQLSAAASWKEAEAELGLLDAIASAAIVGRRPVRRRAPGGVLLGWPLATRQGSVGALAVLAATSPKPSTRRLLQSVADQVALALRTSRLSAAGRDHAVLEERTRLAREIHDTLAQQLTGIVIQLEAAGTLVERGSNRAQQSVQIARELARSALQEARRSVWNLRPAPLSATGLLAAIQREAEAWEARTGVAARVRARSVPSRPSLQPAAEVALLRVVQEALSNVAHHAHASSVEITMRTDGSELVVSVRDNGCGFDPSASRPREDCFGLEGMRERVRSAGGALSVVSAPQSGTEIMARLPLSEPAAEAAGA
ncbi:MAG: HAMP domain-containing protein [Candidatus Dormibacteraeota bacterium]|nr:HAMP domain-containing protein [Candidatus Dormibacteraeota bacterium]